MEFPEVVVCGENTTGLMFGASFARGSFDDDHTVTLLHFPAENTVDTVFVFRLNEDNSGVDVLKEPLTVRAFRGLAAPKPRQTQRSTVQLSRLYTTNNHLTHSTGCWLAHCLFSPETDTLCLTN